MFAQCDWLSGRLLCVVRRVSRAPRAGRSPAAASCLGGGVRRPGGRRTRPAGCRRAAARDRLGNLRRPSGRRARDGAAGCHGRLARWPPWPVTRLPGTTCSIMRRAGCAPWTPRHSRPSSSSHATEAAVTACWPTPPSPTRGGSRSSAVRSKGSWSGRWHSSPGPMRYSPRAARPLPPLPPPRPGCPGPARLPALRRDGRRGRRNRSDVPQRRH